MALAFNPSQPSPAGVVPVQLPGLILGDAAEGPGFEVSSSGILATLPAIPDRLARRLVWVDESNRIAPLPAPVQKYEHVTISPDGKQAVVQILEGVLNLWVYNFERSSLTPLVKAGSSSQAPMWTQDSRRVIYRGTRKGSRNLYWIAADGSGTEERLTTKDGVNQTPQSVSPDGKWAIFSENGGGTGSDLWMVSLGGDHAVQSVLSSPAFESAGIVSPAGGRWLAFTADDSGRVELYVRPFPGPGPRIPISRDGGTEPMWSRDGRRLFFVNGNGFMAADVTLSPSFSASVPRQLYQAPFMSSTTGATPYGLGLDGRFLRVQPVQPEPPATRIDIVVNWRAELRRLVK